MSPTRQGKSKPAMFIGLAGDAPRSPPCRISLADRTRIQVGRGESRSVGDDTITLADTRMSSRHMRLSRVGTEWVVEDLDSKNGTWINGQRTTRHVLADGEAIIVGHTALVFRAAGGELPDVVARPAKVHDGLATYSAALEVQLARLASAARSLAPIEINGETGTGKELAARAVHALSGRPGRFVAINCGAVPASLLEGELFGHRRGAYTGANEDRVGLIRSADSGTLFLDEIVELPATSQAALLRVLQEGEVMPIGGDKPDKVDLRIVTSTHRTLDAEVAVERFRPDLRARLLGVQITMPPLRDRIEDLCMLVATLLDRVGARPDLTFSADAVMALYAHRWPLNIRELEHALITALAVAGDRIELEHLPATLQESLAAKAMPASDAELRDVLVAALARHAGNVSAVARELGKDRTQIRRWMRRFGMSPEE